MPGRERESRDVEGFDEVEEADTEEGSRDANNPYSIYISDKDLNGYVA